MKIRVGGVPEHFNYPWQLAIETGVFGTLGIEVQWIDFPGGTGAMAEALKAQEIDMALALTEGITAHILNGNPLVLCGFYVASPLQWGIHVAANAAIKEWSETEGKRFAISRKFSGSHLMPYVQASSTQHSIKEEQFVEVGNLAGAEKALTEGTADVFFWEKFTTQPFVDKGAFRRIGICPTPWPCFAIAVRSDFYHANNLQVQTLIHTIRAFSSQEKSKHDYAERVAQYYHLRLDQVQEWLHSLHYANGHESMEDALELVIEELKKTGVLQLHASRKNVVIRS
ncbi:MAG: ABC transporter substrate-binding protein [Cytophagaceae bacterium]|jgi:ABC-type nitrate/sulfonate/bicarbonate transport system substrate-binding protein|nr:ABC transporter substrate-binding protein [Cytophagaceae bacterium]